MPLVTADGNWNVYVEAENRQKRLEWAGAAGGTTSTVTLYSQLQNLFDELTQMDDGVPMSAQTPTEFTIGSIDAGDDDPWFIDRTSAEHLTGGALQTKNWARVAGTNTGIVKIGYSQTVALVPGDIGKTIVMTTDGDSGTILDYNDTTNEIWIRPDSAAAANSFDDSPTANGAFTITGGTGTGSQSGGAATTGESLWANIYSIGTLVPSADTHIYVAQNGSLLTGYKTTSDWWSDGHVDILVNVKEVGVEVDAGYVTVFSRHYSQTFDNFEVGLASGGRNPIPLSTGDDLNNTTGYRQFTGSGGVGTFNAGNYIYVGASWAAATAKGVISNVGGTTAAPVLDYYLIGDLTDFANLDSVQEYDPATGANGDASCTAGAPSNVGPAALTGVSITHANTTSDVNQDGTNENYSITINCNNNPLADVYEWTKYLTRRGSTDIANNDGLEGQQYIGSDYRLVYTGVVTGLITEGNTVTQTGTNATGTVVSHNTTAKIIILRNSRGTFNTTGVVTDNTTSGTVTPDSSATAISPIKSASYGTFAGGKWFCSPGVVLTNVPSADGNNYQLVDDAGVVRVAPTTVSVTIGNTRALDSIAVFRLTAAGGGINKTEHTATVQAAGGTTCVVSAPINQDVPGKTVGGAIRLVDASANKEYRLRFSSWTGSTFTLASQTGLVAAAGTNTTTIVDVGTSFTTTVKVGDLVRNITAGGIGYVVSVDSDTQLTTTTISGQTSTDSYEINTLPVATTASDNYYVPLIDTHETTGTSSTPGTEGASIVYSADIETRIRARQAGDILPYEADATVTSNGLSNNIIRTADTIYV